MERGLLSDDTPLSHQYVSNSRKINNNFSESRVLREYLCVKRQYFRKPGWLQDCMKIECSAKIAYQCFGNIELVHSHNSNNCLIYLVSQAQRHCFSLR